MAAKQIIRGDSYEANRPLFVYTFVNDAGTALDLRGYTLFTTYKATKSTPADDPTDGTAAITHSISIDGLGAVTASDGLVLKNNDYALGVIHEHLTATESVNLPLDVELFNDIQLKDSSGRITTFIFVDGLIAADGYTNRTT